MKSRETENIFRMESALCRLDLAHVPTPTTYRSDQVTILAILNACTGLDTGNLMLEAVKAADGRFILHFSITPTRTIHVEVALRKLKLMMNEGTSHF